MFLPAVALAALLAAPGLEPAGGQLCYAKANERVDSLSTCLKTHGASAIVASGGSDRTFLWIGDDGRDATIGFIQSGETKVDLTAGVSIPIPHFAETDEDAWQPVSVELIGSNSNAQVNLPSGATTELRTLKAPS